MFSIIKNFYSYIISMVIEEEEEDLADKYNYYFDRLKKRSKLRFFF